LAECARTTITGLTAGQTYTLYFCGACFGTGTSIYNSSPSTPRIIVGTSTFVPSIPMVAATWNRYSMTFVASAATMTLQCDHPNGSNSYVSLDGFSLSSTAVCKPIILPIELTEFKAVYNKGLKQVDLDWIVAMEKDLDHYLLEKSSDAIHFTETEKIYARYGDHNTHKEYFAYDSKPVAANVNYYRLKMVDKNGEYNYSPVRSVYFTDTDAELMIIPNPANEFAELRFSSPSEKDWIISLYDKRGNKLSEMNHHGSAGTNSFQIGLSTYESGLYFITVSDGSAFYKRKLVKK
jgi:hypothetical protein